MVPSNPQSSDRGPDRTVRVLVVEDDPHLSDYLSIEVGARPLADGFSTEVVAAASLEAALEHVDDVDLVLLDLELPDSQGLDTLLRIVQTAPAVPVIVVTGTVDEEFGEMALAAGANEFLRKGDYDRDTLLRSIRHALARHRYFLSIIDVLARRRTAEEQIAVLESLGAGGTSVAARSAGRSSLSETFPDVFETARTQYGELVAQYVEERGLEVDYNVASRAKALAGDVALLRVTPRDVVDVHVAALRDLTDGVGRGRVRALMDAGQILLVQVLGHLASYYRAQAVGRAVGLLTPLEQPPPPDEGRPS